MRVLVYAHLPYIHIILGGFSYLGLSTPQLQFIIFGRPRALSAWGSPFCLGTLDVLLNILFISVNYSLKA